MDFFPFSGVSLQNTSVYKKKKKKKKKKKHHRKGQLDTFGFDSVQIWKFIECFQKCKLNGTICWVYNKTIYFIIVIIRVIAINK